MTSDCPTGKRAFRTCGVRPRPDGRPVAPLIARSTLRAAAGIALVAAMSLVTFCDERFPCSGGVFKRRNPSPATRQDGRYEAPSPAPAPRMILVVGPSVRPLQPPARRPTDGLHNPSASIAVRALAGGDSKNLLRVTDRTPDPRSKAAVARDPKPTSSPLAHQPAARQVEGSRVRAPRVPASTVEEVKTPAAEKTSPAAKGSPAEFDLDSRPIGSLTTNIQCQQGDLPQDVAQARLQAMRDRPYNELVDREWERLCYLWEAPALRHKPLYFEELNLERYGYGGRGLQCSTGPVRRPLLRYVSAPAVQDVVRTAVGMRLHLGTVSAGQSGALSGSASLLATGGRRGRSRRRGRVDPAHPLGRSGYRVKRNTRPKAR